jgi:hypothetical protein
MNKPSLKNKKLLLSFGLLGFMLLATAALADDTVLGGTSCAAEGNCQLNDFMLVAVQISKIILGLSGSVALLAFIAGGIMFLASAGNKTWIDRGKAAITGAVIGLAIVFASWTIIGFIITNISSGPQAKDWFSSNWFKQ